MKASQIKKIIFEKNSSVKNVLRRFETTTNLTDKRGFGIIVDYKYKCLGIITEGDIRRYIISGGDIENKALNISNKNYKYLSKSDNDHKILRLFGKNISTLPILDKNHKLIDVLNYSEFKKKISDEYKIVRSRCPLRISFSGGGTDFSEHINDNETSILTSSINKYCRVTLKKRRDKSIIINSLDFKKKEKFKSLSLIQPSGNLGFIKSIILFLKPQFGFELITNSDCKPGSGLGGSSALVSSIISAFLEMENKNKDDLYEIANKSFQAERLEIGISGGWQDFYACIFGGFNNIEFDTNDVYVNSLNINRQTILELENNLILFNLNKKRNSSVIQNKNIKNIIENKKKFTNFSKKMFDLTKKMQKLLIKNKIDHFGKMINTSWKLKKGLNINISNKFVENLINIAISSGALGCKLLGAGETGYLLVHSNPDYHENIVKKFKKYKVSREKFSFTSNGLETWTLNNE